MNNACLKESNQSVGNLIEQIVDLLLSQDNSELIGTVTHQRPCLAVLLEDVYIILRL